MANPYDEIYSNNYRGRILDVHHNTIQTAFDRLEIHDHLTIVAAPPVAEVLGKSLAYDSVARSFYLWDGSAWQVPPGGGERGGTGFSSKP